MYISDNEGLVVNAGDIGEKCRRIPGQIRSIFGAGEYSIGVAGVVVRTVSIISIVFLLTVSCDLDTDVVQRPPGLYIFFSPCGARIPVDDEWTGFTELNDIDSRFSVGYYCVDCGEEGMNAGFPLISTNESIAVGLGSSVLPCLEGIPGAADSIQTIWIGLHPPKHPLPEGVIGWWAEADSMIACIIREALDDTLSEKGLIVVGYDLGKESLKTVRDSGDKVQFVDPATLSGGSRAVFAAYPGRSVLIMEAPPTLVTLAGSRLYWVAECPFLEPERTVVSLELDWVAALDDILQFMQGEDGPEPGSTLGPYLRMVRRGEDIS